MDNIIFEENIVIDKESKDYIITLSNNSIRTLISLLEKIYIYNKPIDKNLCIQICSIISHQRFESYLNQLKNNNLADAIQIMYEIYDYGYSVIDIFDYLFAYIKITDQVNDDIKYKITKLLCKYITIFNMIHEDCIELALFTGNMIEILKN